MVLFQHFAAINARLIAGGMDGGVTVATILGAFAEMKAVKSEINIAQVIAIFSDKFKV